MLPLLVMGQKKQLPKNNVVIQGTIKNAIDSLNIRLYDPISNKTIIVKIDKEGKFSQAFNVTKPTTFTAVYKNAFGLYVANGTNLKIEIDTKEFSKSLTFTGKGETENNFLKFKAEQDNILFGDDYKEYYDLDQAAFDQKTTTYIKNITDYLEAKKSVLNPVFVTSQKEKLKTFEKDNLLQYQEQQKINKALAPGNDSPEFNNYINFAGGTSSLKDFRGSYVYIDVWATWCGPCKYEIPFLQKVEEAYHGKNIKFVSVSVDFLKDEAKWRKMITDKKMGGIQLLADKDNESSFIQEYFIYGIPRFILLDPNGKIINYDAPRPSEEKLKTLLNGLSL